MNEQKDFNEETIDDSQEERAKNFNQETNDNDDLPFAKAALGSPWHHWELRRRGDCSSCSPKSRLPKILNN